MTKQTTLGIVGLAAIIAVVAITIIILAGFAPVKLYSNSGLTESTGLKYYTLKPYLQVERASNNSILKITVIYLSDLENPQYMVINFGLGSRKVDLKLTDGAISTLSLSSDSKIPESIDALTGLISKGTSSVTNLTVPKSKIPTLTTTPTTELYDIIMDKGVTSFKKIEIK